MAQTADSILSNSCIQYNRNYLKKPLKYSYHDSTGIHDYSGNWDFDGDGILDNLFFVSTTGAHAFYYLKIESSTEEKYEDLKFIEIDFPCLDSTKDMSNELNHFAVNDFDKDGLPEIYIRVNSCFGIPGKWRRKGLSSNCMIIEYVDNKMRIRNSEK